MSNLTQLNKDAGEEFPKEREKLYGHGDYILNADYNEALNECIVIALKREEKLWGEIKQLKVVHEKAIEQASDVDKLNNLLLTHSTFEVKNSNYISNPIFCFLFDDNVRKQIAKALSDHIKKRFGR